eukprot:3043130-Rhodomonas_salina.2
MLRRAIDAVRILANSETDEGAVTACVSRSVPQRVACPGPGDNGMGRADRRHQPKTPNAESSDGNGDSAEQNLRLRGLDRARWARGGLMWYSQCNAHWVLYGSSAANAQHARTLTLSLSHAHTSLRKRTQHELPFVSTLLCDVRVPACAAGFANGVHAFDPESMQWADLSLSASGAPPEGSWKMGVAAVRGRLVVFGGDATTYARGASCLCVFLRGSVGLWVCGSAAHSELEACCECGRGGSSSMQTDVQPAVATVARGQGEVRGRGDVRVRGGDEGCAGSGVL